MLSIPSEVLALLENPDVPLAFDRRIRAGISLINRSNMRESNKGNLSTENTSNLTLVWRDPTAKSVSIRGTFTDPPWMNDLECYRDGKDRLFKADLTTLSLGPGTYLYKFLVDGVWRVDRGSPKQKDRDGVINNFIFLKTSLRPLKQVRSAPNFPAETPAPLLRRRTLENLEGEAVSVGESRTNFHVSLELHCGSCRMPHPGKIKSADAVFFNKRGAGVSDSVGEWEWRFKLDPSDIAEEIMIGCLNQIEQGVYDASVPMGEVARNILKKSFDKSSSFGSATACIGVLDKEGSRIGVANLGDSVFLHFRKNEQLPGFTCIAKTREQQHSFNTPFQLTRIPSIDQFEFLHKDPKLTYFIETLKSLGNSKPSFDDTPDKADVYESPLEEGDLLIFASDGLLDNLWLVEVTALVSQMVSPLQERQEDIPQTNPEIIAQRIAAEAFKQSQETTGSRSPFAYNSKRYAHRMAHQGGKPDDISVVACWVVRNTE